MGYSYQHIGVVRSGADRATLVRRTYALVFASVCVTVLGTWFGLGQPQMMAAVVQHPWITMLCTFAPLFLAMRERPVTRSGALAAFNAGLRFLSPLSCIAAPCADAP